MCIVIGFDCKINLHIRPPGAADHKNIFQKVVFLFACKQMFSTFVKILYKCKVCFNPKMLKNEPTNPQTAAVLNPGRERI